MLIKIKILFIFILFLFIQCNEEDVSKVKGIYIDDDHYEVIAYGKAPAEIQNSVKARNMSREAALILAQKNVKEEFEIPDDKIIQSGFVKNVKYIDQTTCRLVYIVNIKKLIK